MSVFPVPRRRFDPSNPEMVDLPDPDPELLKGEMRNLRKINRRFGGGASVREVLELAKRAEPGRQLEILDLATGSADLPADVLRSLTPSPGRPHDQRARAAAVSAAVTAIDRSEHVLAEARAYTSGIPGMTLVRGNVLEMDYPDRSFDLVICSLALHHFSRADAVRVLSEMRRLCRIGFVALDLRRSYAALAAAWLYTRTTTFNIMTRTDAIRSVLAAYTVGEVEEMMREAGITGGSVRRIPVFRFAARYPAN